jgi:uncharacterized repeat protein (TIGR02543 family)
MIYKCNSNTQIVTPICSIPPGIIIQNIVCDANDNLYIMGQLNLNAYFAKYDVSTKSWNTIVLNNDNSGSIIYDVLIDNNTIYLTGAFNNIQGSTANNIASYKNNTSVYTVKYYANGGTGGVPIDMNLYNRRDLVNLKIHGNLSIEGYIFIGWMDSSGLTYPNSFNIAGDAILYAEWSTLGTKVWSRFQPNCSSNPFDPDNMKYKANVLQYKQNSSNLTKSQRYSQIVNGYWSNRKKTWATQSQTYTNPNNSIPISCENKITCFPSSNSGVPGQTLLCSQNNTITSLFPIQRRVMSSGGNKFPQGYKFI